MTENRKTQISFLMPALNEEANIATALDHARKAFDSYEINGEIIVVDDGSTDNTSRIVEEKMAEEGAGRIRMIRHPRPQGVGASFRDGLREARGEVIAFMPGDDENEPGEILRYYPLLRDVDMVVPFVYNKEVRPARRNLLSTIYRMIINVSFGVNFNYTNGTVLYRRVILADSPNTSDGFFFQTENIVRAARRGYLFAEVPYRLDVRASGESKAVSLSSLVSVIKSYLVLFRESYFVPRSARVSLAPDSISVKRRAGVRKVSLS